MYELNMNFRARSVEGDKEITSNDFVLKRKNKANCFKMLYAYLAKSVKNWYLKRTDETQLCLLYVDH